MTCHGMGNVVLPVAPGVVLPVASEVVTSPPSTQHPPTDHPTLMLCIYKHLVTPLQNKGK